MDTSSRHLGPPPKRYYTLIYHYRGRLSKTWIHRFTSYDGFRFLGLVYSVDTWQDDRGGTWPPLVSMGLKEPWNRQSESAMSWFRTFSFVLRWAVILDPDGRVVFDWKRRKEIVTYQLLEIPKEYL